MKYKGLTTQEAKERLIKYGKNEIKEEKKISPLSVFLSQFKSPLILLLIAASIVSFLVNYYNHEGYFDSILILIIVLAAGICGFIQEWKAEKTIESLKKLATPKAKVIRDGKEQEIDATEIVPDDLIVLESGDVIPADAIIIEGELEVNESILTGESKAEMKKEEDKIFSGCSVYTGKAIAKVFATGMNTQLGKIASKMQEIREEETPFQHHMKKFTKKLVIFTLLIILITFIVGYRKFGLIDAGLIAISLAVAAVPEDLPAVITIALSLGAREMAKKNALIRKLAITESVGAMDVICTDKTGTLTEGKMKVRDIWLIDQNNEKHKEMALNCCYFCNDAKTILKDNKEIWVGDETDIALKQFSMRYINRKGERIDEIPFSSERKMMSVLCKIDGNSFVFSKGAPEVIIEKCDLSKEVKEKILEENKKFASKGYRVLGLAYKESNKLEEKDLAFLGLVILSDPPRPEVKKAIKECYDAGINVIMITGDNPLTAKAIAQEIGMREGNVVTGDEIDRMSDEDLERALERANIFARTNPFHKLRILEILQRKHNVAMTGDGVNDSLALKKANVGIAMGIKGTEVAKEASDIILLDDNFASIRNAIKEGRRIFDNIRKFVDYLLTCNVAEVVTVLIATMFMPFISLYPIQILWINLITDGLPALALSVDPPRPDVMKRKPRKKEEGIINKKLGFLIVAIGIKKAMVLFFTFLIALYLWGEEKARTILFTSFILYEFVRIAVIRYNEKLLSIKENLKNKYLIFSLFASIILQLMILYTSLSGYFKVIPLEISEWILLFIGATIGFILGILIAWISDKIIKEEY